MEDCVMVATKLFTLVPLVLTVALGALTPMGLAGCNTTAGMGKDIEAAGDAIEDKAEEEKGY
jgi:predicted small secreted protein